MSKVRFELRPFAAPDLPRLHNIRNRAFAAVYRSFRDLVGPDVAPVLYADAEEQQGGWLDRICQPGSHHTILVALVNGVVAGFCDYSCDIKTRVGTIGLNAVDPDFAGQGLGTALYEHALGGMREEGMRVATVSTGLDDSHVPARRAYAKAGFAAAVPAVQLSRLL